MRFFPIVPYNVPRDDLAKYLEMYDSAAEALLASRDADVHTEWDINVRAPVMRSGAGLSFVEAMTASPNGDRARRRHALGYTSVMTANPNGDHAARRGSPRGDLSRTLVSHMRLEGGYDPDVFASWTIGVIGQPMGPDPMRLTNLQAGLDIVDPTWAQRAVNAFLATVGATPVGVDGNAGPQTLTALRFAMLRFYAAASHTPMQPDTGQTNIDGIPMPVRSGVSVALPVEFSRYLATLTQVADPPLVPRSRPSTPTPTDTTRDVPTDPPVEFHPPVTPGAASGGGLLVLFALGAGAWYLSKRR